VKPRTIRHRARALRELYQSLDGARVRHPLEGVTLPTISRPAPVPVPASTIRKVAASLKKRLNPVHRARFLVYATTGQRPSQIGRAKPKDLDLRRRIWWVQPAKGGDPLPLPLNDEAVVAWRAFAAARAWGSFDPSTLSKILRRHGWPPGIRPYQLRHTFAIELLLGGADLGDVQGLLGHTSVLTTRQYYAPVLLQHLRSTVAKRTIGFGAKGSVPKRAGATRQNTAKSGDFRRARRTEKKDVRKRKRP
jgi:integrase